MSLANYIDAVTSADRQTVSTVLLIPYNRKDYAPRIRRMILKDVPWVEARESLEIPYTDSHRDLPPTFRIDTTDFYYNFFSSGNDWAYMRHWRLPGAR